jgi:hypothetical protein
MMNKLNNYLHTPNWLFLLLILLLLLRVPTLFEPYHHSFEMTYLTTGEGIRQGIPLYKGLYDSNPPFIHLTAALAGSLFWFKAILIIWHLVTTYLFWKLTDVLYPKKEELQRFATVVFAVFTTLPLLEGNKVSTEVFMIAPLLAAFLVIFSKINNSKNLVAAGILLSMASLFKVSAIFDLLAILYLWIAIANTNRQGIKRLTKRIGFLMTGFLIPILIVFTWYLSQSSLDEYVKAVYMQKFSFMTTWHYAGVQKYQLFLNASLLFRAFLLSAALIFLYVKRASFSKNFIFLTAWLLITLFSVTLSGKPYPHNLIQSVPPAAILLALLFTQKTMESLFAIIPLTILVLVPYYYKYPHYPTFSYYQQFLKLTANKVSKNEYFASFNNSTIRNYQIAETIKRSTKPGENILVWGSDATIYSLSKRLPPIKYITDDQVKKQLGYKNIINELVKDPPELVIIVPEAKPSAEMESFLKQNYAETETADEVSFWKLLGPTVRSLLAP